MEFQRPVVAAVVEEMMVGEIQVDHNALGGADHYVGFAVTAHTLIRDWVAHCLETGAWGIIKGLKQRAISITPAGESYERA